MNGLGKLTKVAGPRLLLVGMIITGMLGSQGGNGTLAFFTSSVQSTSQFRAGVIDLTGQIGGGNGTSLPSFAAFSWNTEAGSNCGNMLNTPPETLLGTEGSQRMAPGHYCVTPITIRNDSPNAVDAWLRMRLVRNTQSDIGAIVSPTATSVTATGVGTGGDFPAGTYYYVVTATATDNDGTTAVETGILAGISAADAVVPTTTLNTGSVVVTWPAVARATGYKIYRYTGVPVLTNPLDTTEIGAFDLVASVSGNALSYIDTTVSIANSAGPVSGNGASNTAIQVPGPSDQLNNRLRFYMHEYVGGTNGLSILGDGERLAAQTADCAPDTYKPSTANYDATIQDGLTIAAGVTREALSSLGATGRPIGRGIADTAINNLSDLNVTAAQSAISTNGGAIDLRTGTNTAAGVTITETQMNFTTPDGTADAQTQLAFNIVGNDTVSDPTNPAAGNPGNVGGVPVAGGGATYADESDLVGTFGDDALAGSAKAVRYFCAAVFFPHNTQLVTANSSPDASNTDGDNLAQSGANIYTLVVTAAQKAGR